MIASKYLQLEALSWKRLEYSFSLLSMLCDFCGLLRMWICQFKAVLCRKQGRAQLRLPGPVSLAELGTA